MARSRSHGSSYEEAGVDMTPMLDVVFIMLIFFIVTTSFVKEAGVDVNRPSAQTGSTEESGNIMIAIRPNGEIWMDKRQVDIRSVRANIERMRAENPEGTVVVLADEQSNTGLLVEVMDQVRMGGIDDVSIATSDSTGG
jgi:biopolymer transport protein ExbD